MGCTNTQVANVTYLNLLNLTYSTTPSNCNTNTGTATIYTNGLNPPYTYLWTDGQTTQTATGLPVGIISCVVSDSSGCSQTQQITIHST